MKKVPFKLAFIFAVFVAFTCLSCKTDSESDDSYIENPDANKDADKDNENAPSTPTPPAKPKPKAKIRVHSKSLYEIYIYSDSERQNLVVQIPANESTVFETEQIGEAIFYYTFLISPENDSGITIPFYDNNCAFLLATNADEVAEQTISSPKSISLSSCFVVLKNESEKSIQLMNESFVVSPYKTASTTSPIINPKKSACYVIEKNNFSNIGSYSVREALGTSSLPLKSIIADFEGCKIYTVVYDGKAIKLAAEIGQEELIGMKAYSVTHKCERLDSEEYETSETETVYGFPEEMTEAAPKEYEGFEAEDVEQQEIAGDGSTNIEICYKRIRTTLTFNANGGTFGDGSESKTLQGKYGAEVEIESPTWENTDFLGWSAEIPKTFGTEDKAFNAKWNRPLISYAVTHTVESLLDAQVFEEKESETLSGYLGAMTSAMPKEYEGLEAEGVVQQKIVRDASIKIEIRYKRIVTTLTFNANGGKFSDGSEAKTLEGKYGASVEIENPARNDDSDFLGWDEEVPKSFGTENKTFNAKWGVETTKEATKYTVSDVINSCKNSSYIYTIKLTGEITDSTLETVARALADNKSVNFILDISEATGVSTLKEGAFNYPNTSSNSCTNLVEVVLNDEITEIEQYAFRNCTNLKNITIPKNVKTIGVYPFSGCTALSSVVISNGVTAISDYMFDGCTSLASVTIPDSVTSIGRYAFRKCTNLQKAVIGNGVKEIGEYAFSGCTSLESVSAQGSKLETVGASAFSNCTNLTSITIPNSITTINSNAFSSCNALKYNEVDNACYLGNDSNEYLVLVKARDTNITSCAINSSAKIIYYEAFKDCANLTNVTIPSSVKKIGGMSVSASGTELEISSNVQAAQFDKYNITSVIISDGVTSIGTSAFSGCASLVNVTVLAATPPSLGTSAFSGNANGRKIRVPCASVSAYKSRWSAYSSYIELISHNFSAEWKIDTTNHWHECVDCGSKKDTNAHAWDAGKVTKAATCTATGVKTYTCTTCGKTKTETINKTEHSYSAEWKSDATNHWYECVDCGAKKDKTVHLNPVKLTGAGEREESCSTCGFVGTTAAWTSKTLPELSAALKNYAETEANIKVAGEITNDDITTIKNALTVNKTKKVALDLSGTTGLTEIGDNGFYNLTSLASIIIPDSVTEIGGNAFRSCINLASVTIPSSVTSIGSSVFRDCTKLEGVTIPNSVKKLCGITVSVDGTNVKISNSVHTIADRAFSGEFDKHYNITSVTIPSSVTSMGNYAFENCTSLASIIIPGSVTEIGFDAFSGCASLVRVTLPNTITNISSGMFQDCTSLESIVIPKSVDDIIYSRAFKGCTNLKNLILEGKATLCDEVFFGCTNLKNVTLKSKTPPMILYAGQGKYPFEDNIIARIYVPAESVEEYKASKYWVHYKDKIFAIEEE